MISGDYYANAVVDNLREDLELFPSTSAAEHNVKIMPDNRPFPGCGTLFLGIRTEQIQAKSDTLPLFSELSSISIAVTLRTTTASHIDVGDQFLIRRDRRVDFQQSLYHIIRHVFLRIHLQDSIIAHVQNAICEAEGVDAYPALGVLRFKNLEKPRIVDYAHFGEHTEDSNTNQDAGMMQVITFGDGERLA